MKFGFVVREGFGGLRRNITMTIALVITAAISLALLSAAFLVTSMTERTKDIYLDRVEVMIQLDDELSDQDPTCEQSACIAIREELESEKGITSITFRNREESYNRFVEIFQDTDPQLVAETSSDALPAAFHVRLEDPLDSSPLETVRTMPHVAEVVDQSDDLHSATDNLDAVRNATFLLALVQGIAALMLIINMVQIAAFNRREETRIMRIVGASRWYTQAPFIFEAVFSAFLGTILAVAGLFGAKSLVLDHALKSLYDSQLIAPISTNDIWSIGPVVGLGGIIFAALAAGITLRLYSKK